MENQYLCDDEHINRLAEVIRTSSFQEVTEEIRTGNSSRCSSLLVHREVVFTHRLDMLLGINNITLSQLVSLGLNPYYRLIATEFNRAARNLLTVDGYQNLGGTTLEMIFPSHLKLLYGNRNEHLVLRQISEPIILSNQGLPAKKFATINHYEIVGTHLPGSYFHIHPLIKKNGIVCPESSKVIRNAGPEIYKRLPFTGAELDILEELAKVKKMKDVGQNLNKGENYIGEYLQKIRNKTRQYELGLNPQEFAYALKALSVI